MATAEIDFGSIKKCCHMACVPDARVDDYVLVHAGIALTIIDCDAAQKLLAGLSEIDDFEIREMSP